MWHFFTNTVVFILFHHFSPYRNISLSAKPTEITKLAYTHEIAHSQLNHIKGIIKDFYNTEVISILLESIHALEADPTERLLYVHDTNRLKDLYYIIKELNKYHSTDNPEIKNILLEGSLYLQSTLQAYNLFIKFYYGTEEVQSKILEGIQAVFDLMKVTYENAYIFRMITDNREITDNLETYLTDHFVFRDTFRSIKSFVSINLLKNKDNNDLFEKDGAIYKMEYPLNEVNVAKSTDRINSVYEKYLQGMNVYYAIIPDKNYYLDKIDTVLKDLKLRNL